MRYASAVITGIGLVAPGAYNKESFWNAQLKAENYFTQIDAFPSEHFSVRIGAQVKNFDPTFILGQKGLRNLDRNALFLLAASKQVIDEAKLEIDESNTDTIGICTGTTFAHLWAITEFDKEVFKECTNIIVK
jgi:3-oxoacyl-[acyl-carrier-protein] synthase II